PHERQHRERGQEGGGREVLIQLDEPTVGIHGKVPQRAALRREGRSTRSLRIPCQRGRCRRNTARARPVAVGAGSVSDGSWSPPLTLPAPTEGGRTRLCLSASVPPRTCARGG